MKVFVELLFLHYSSSFERMNMGLGFVGRVVSTVVQAEMVKEGYNLLWLLLLFGGNADVLGKVRPSWCFGQHREKVFRVFNGCSRVSAASWQRTSFEAAISTEDTGQEHRNIFYLAPKVLFLLQHIFSPLNLPFICV
ncbi:hypothetical protein Peur_025030 [Populus x canadensis]